MVFILRADGGVSPMKFVARTSPIGSPDPSFWDLTRILGAVK